MGKGRRVTDAQVKELRQNLNRRASLQQAAMKAGMDRKTGRKYRDRGQLPSECRAARTWRTRVDPLVEVWPRLEELLQADTGLQAKTLVEVLRVEYPGQDWQSRRRTVERRVRQWKAEHGKAKEVFFSQVHEPGRLGASDFTHMDGLNVTIQGQPFPHLVYHFVLTHSNWEHVTLCFSESFASLSEGLQNAFWELGAVPERHRTDRMTLAVNHEGHPEQYTMRYQALMSHYGVTAEATNAYSGHENGDCEQGHRRFKEALEQELLLRGSRDFTSREEYWEFVRALVARRNRGRGDKFAAEQARLRPLPNRRLETLERERVRVSQGATIQVKKNTYSVPARLKGEWVETRIGSERIEVWYAGAWVQTMERLRGQAKHRIDYRHVIDWLVRKPGAFARYVYREDLYPTVTYRRCYDALQLQQAGRADREYVRLLYLASREGESRVEAALVKLLDQMRPLSEQAVRTLLGNETPLSVAAQVAVPAVDLRLYDALLDEGSAAESDRSMSLIDGRREVTDEPRRDGGVGTLSTGTAFGCGAEPIRSGGPTGDGGVVELWGFPAGIAGTRVPAASAQTDRAAAESVEAVVGEELVGVGPEASAGEGAATVAEPVERGVSGPSGERAGVWSAGLGEESQLMCGGPGVGAGRPAGVAHEMQSAGAGVAEGQARPASEGTAAGTVALGGFADRRPGLCAAESGGDGGAVHAAGGALRAGQRDGDEQPGLLAMGANLQGSDDDGCGNRPPGAPQRHHGDECSELSGGIGQANQGRTDRDAGLRGVEGPPRWGSGSAPGTVAALRFPTLTQIYPHLYYSLPRGCGET